MRNELEGRPLIAFVAALIVGLTLPTHPVNVIFCVPILMFWQALPVRGAIAGCALIGALLGPTPVAQVEVRQLINEEVTIQSVPRIYPDQISFEVVTDRGLAYQVYVEGTRDYMVMDRIHVTGMARPPAKSAQKYMAIRGISGVLKPTEHTLVRRGPALYGWANAWRLSFDQFAQQCLPPRIAAVVSALCFNMDRLLDDDFMQELQRTGTVHIVSVSGLHIVVLAVSVLWTLGRLPIPRWMQLLVAIVALSFYALATGLNPPTVRAVLMAAIGFAAYLLGREGDWLTALTATAFVYLLIRPAAVYDIGFQLSFATVAAFCLFLPPNREALRSPLRELASRAKQVALTSLIASIASAPLVAYHFGQFSIVSVIANLLIAVVVPAIIVGSFLSYAVSLIFPPVASWVMATLIGPWVGFLFAVVSPLSSLDAAVIRCPEFSGYLLVPIYAAMLMMWGVNVRRA
jgi:competence protein ComEC